MVAGAVADAASSLSAWSPWQTTIMTAPTAEPGLGPRGREVFVIYHSYDWLGDIYVVLIVCNKSLVTPQLYGSNL